MPCFHMANDYAIFLHWHRHRYALHESYAFWIFDIWSFFFCSGRRVKTRIIICFLFCIHIFGLVQRKMIFRLKSYRERKANLTLAVSIKCPLWIVWSHIKMSCKGCLPLSFFLLTFLRVRFFLCVLLVHCTREGRMSLQRRNMRPTKKVWDEMIKIKNWIWRRCKEREIERVTGLAVYKTKWQTVSRSNLSKESWATSSHVDSLFHSISISVCIYWNEIHEPLPLRWNISSYLFIQSLFFWSLDLISPVYDDDDATVQMLLQFFCFILLIRHTKWTRRTQWRWRWWWKYIHCTVFCIKCNENSIFY